MFVAMNIHQFVHLHFLVETLVIKVVESFHGQEKTLYELVYVTNNIAQ